MDERRAGFDEFVAAQASRLLRSAYLLTADRGAAEDLLQEALERLYVAWPRSTTRWPTRGSRWPAGPRTAGGCDRAARRSRSARATTSVSPTAVPPLLSATGCSPRSPCWAPVVSGVSVAILWLWIFQPSGGLANHILNLLGLPSVGWIYCSRWVIPAFVLMGLSGVGQTAFIYLAVLQRIPPTFTKPRPSTGLGPSGACSASLCPWSRRHCS